MHEAGRAIRRLRRSTVGGDIQFVKLILFPEAFNKEAFPEGAVREGVEELTFRRGEEGMLRTSMDTNEGCRRQWMGTHRWWIEDLAHMSGLEAMGARVCSRIEEWEMNKEVNVRNPSGRQQGAGRCGR